jgi:hypothetical protein
MAEAILDRRQGLEATLARLLEPFAEERAGRTELFDCRDRPLPDLADGKPKIVRNGASLPGKARLRWGA